ncbi:MAG: adenosylcobinamide-GDP ribazoletransferase [Pseudomonadota bacterium]
MDKKIALPDISWHDVPAAMGLLTRVPVQVDAERAMARSNVSVWAYPIVGLALGLLTVPVAFGLMSLGLSAGLAAGLLLLAWIFLTGALHEDGLADCADGFWGAYSAPERLRIMKDSHIGTYGTLALVFSIGLRWLAVSELLQKTNLDWASWQVALALIALPAISRAGLPIIMSQVSNARGSGLSASQGIVPLNAGLLSLCLGLVIGLISFGFLAVPVLVLTGLAGWLWIRIAQTKIGGQTGDVLGATQQICEITALIVLTTLI